VALMAIHDKAAHHWSEQELLTIREVTERSWTQIQRVRSEAALRELNQTLEERIEERTRRLLAAEEALRQSQKMEAIGQLTGGIAHDFNNLLTAVTGGLDLIETRLRQGRPDQVERYIDMARSGAKRAAALTQRLLAFARRQTLAPTPTDVDELVSGMQDMIDRTLGPAIDLTISGTDGLWPVMVDTPQLESALLNLCINARDAMPDGGRLAIATANLSFEAAEAAAQDLAPGDYVALSVTDTGSGMSPETLKRVFDPFFTTKPLGQGTGLGLSMIYGFTRQSGGQVQISSAPGQGTTVRLFLPRAKGGADQVGRSQAHAELSRSGAGETILVVEDEQPIRELVSDVLEHAGYSVLLASNGHAGIERLRTAEKVDLLITDVGLPGGLDGRQVADAGRAISRGLRTLFITGYAANAAVRAGQLEPGMEVLTKPFGAEELARRVRAMLDRKP
jgi:signal transduction histidine kinase/ActR/RegA family two-component response regulator